MLIHRKFNEETGLYDFTLEREHWTEWFRVAVDGRVDRSDYGMIENLPWYLVKMEYNHQMDQYRYWHFLLFPYVVARIFVVAQWFTLGQWIYKNRPHWIELPPPGVAQSWFWPRYLTIFKWKKKK